MFEDLGLKREAAAIQPRILYDPTVERFFLTVGETDSSTAPGFYTLYYAVSKDGEGTAWHIYKQVLNSDTENFCKDRRYGVLGSWVAGRTAGPAGRWFITGNDGIATPDVGTYTSFILSIGKRETLRGAASTIKCFNTES